MQIRTFCLRFDPELGGFDDESLRQFLDEHVVFDMDVHLTSKDGVPLWAVFVRYRASADESKSSTSLRALEVPADVKPLFEMLRRWRNLPSAGGAEACP